MMRYKTLEDAVSLLRDKGMPFALMHEAAVAAWGLDANAFLPVVDAMVPADALPEAVGPDACCHIHAGETGVELRLWPDIALLGDDVRKHDLWCEAYSCRVLEPELVLDLLPMSPDYQALYEQRARLAEVLYFDKMTDEDLLRFARYVRGR